MTNLPRFLFRCSLVAFAPIAANAAGTYYNGTYQSPQNRYTQKTYMTTTTTTRQGAYNTANRPGAYSAYSSTRPVVGQRTTQQTVRTTEQIKSMKQNASANQSRDAGSNLWLNGGISRQVAMWQFEMKEAASKLHYDNIDWYVLDLNGGYDFNVGNMALRLTAGLQYGIQGGESTMVDDDVTNGGYFITQWVDGSNNNAVIGNQIGHVLSVGSSSGGSMTGFNVGLGARDMLKWGNLKITPSVGYRYLKYKLETEKNYGLSVDSSACFTVDGSDEVQCDPAIVIHYPDGTQQVVWRDKIGEMAEIPSGAAGASLDTGGTYYYEQPGTSHSYEVSWAGPYLALDMEYDINANNVVDGRVEIGLPNYKSIGDQPYRFDWAHPKSVEDTASIGSAFHLGLGANWRTAITDTVSLSLGVTYDYYSVGSADAKTYLNEKYYDDVFNTLLEQWAEKYPQDTEYYMLGLVEGVPGDPRAINIAELGDECPNGVCSTSGEIKSFYKSLGVRLGISARF